MIPKVIHYCWFGGKPLPPLAEKCIASWKKYLPDYEIKRWDESNFDVNIIPYTKQAYEAKKYAFVSDYARFWILYNYGGIYFDTDVEVIKPLEDIIAAGPFMGCENPSNGGDPEDLRVAAGLGMGVSRHLPIIKEFLDQYSLLQFKRKDGSFNQLTVVSYVTNCLCKYNLKNTPEIQKVAGMFIYSDEYFCPLNYQTGILNITDKTVTIHHYTASWKTSKDKMKELLVKIMPKAMVEFLLKIKYRINN